MRIKIIIAILALCGLCSWAVERDTSRFYDGARADDLVEVNPHIGVGLSSILQNYGSEIPGLSDLLLSPGCTMQAGMDVRFNLRNSFGLCTGLNFGIKNSRYGLTIVEGTTGSVSTMYVGNHFYELTAPVYLSFRFNLGRHVEWNADLGVYISYGLGGTKKARGYTSGENSLGQPIVTNVEYETAYFSKNRPYINSIKRTDWGPRVATGIVYKRKFDLNVVFELSAKNLAVNQGPLNIYYRNLALIFQFGVII